MNRLKLLILSSAFLTLSGCGTLQDMYDAYFMAGYDNNEYALVNQIRTESELNINKCTDDLLARTVFVDLYDKSVELKNFSQYVPDNEDAFKLASGLVELSKQGKDAYDKGDKVSPTFCKLKLKSINRASEKAQEVIGKKPR